MSMQMLTITCFKVAADCWFTLRARHIPGRLNQLADESTRPDSRHRMDHESTGGHTTLGSFGTPAARLDGNPSNPKTTDLRQPVPRYSGICGRRNVIVLGTDGRVSVSTVGHDAVSPFQASPRDSLHSDSHHPMVAHQSMVPHTPRTSDISSTETTATGRFDSHASQRPSVRLAGHASDSCIQSVIQQSIDSGFSRAVSQRLAKGHQRDSSLKLYSARWKRFADCVTTTLQIISKPL